MTPTERVELAATDLDTVAWRFLRSEFTSQIYADWPLERRIDAYLLHHGPSDVLNDGSAYNALVDRVMANIGTAMRKGVCQQAEGYESS